MEKNHGIKVRLFLSFLILSILISCKSSRKTMSVDKQDVIYDQRINKSLIELSINDFFQNLNKVDNSFSKTISLSLVINNNQNFECSQSFHIKTANNEVKLTANYEDGLRNGLYYLLEQMGFRFYFPGELWSHYPQKLSLPKLDKIVNPKFLNVNFAGGGGYSYSHPADPNNYVLRSWELWKQRNRFYESFAVGGHYWQTFIERHKEIIKLHPEYISKSGNQICISNEAVQDLFIKDIIKNIENNIKVYGLNHPQAKAISIEPSDGGGHCECNRCLKLGSVSNRVFSFSNVIAKAIKKVYPDVTLSLLAYNEHAGIPDFKIEDNVNVTITPYAFQDEAAPQVFIEKWAKHHNNIGIYDYWGVMIWNKCQPLKSYLSFPEEKIKLWKKYGVKNITIETSYGIGEAGIPLYLLSKFGWSDEINANSEYEKLMNNSFGESSAIMKKVFSRWSDGFNLTYEKYASSIDFEAAHKKATKKTESERITSFYNYFNFLRFLENIESTNPNTPERKNAIETTINYGYSILPSLMIHSYWVPHPFITLYGGNFDDYRRQEISKSATYFESMKPDLLAKNLKAVDKIGFIKLIDEDNRKERVVSTRTSPITNRSTDVQPRNINTINSFNWLYETKEDKIFTFDIGIVKFPNEVPKCAINLSIYNSENNIVVSKRYVPGRSYSSEKIQLTKGKYRIEFRLSNGTMNLKWHDPKNIELIPGTEVDFGEYFIECESENELIFTTFWLPKFLNNEEELKVEIFDKFYKLKSIPNRIMAKGGTVISPLGKVKIYLN